MILVKKSSKQEESYTQGTLLLIFFVMDLPRSPFEWMGPSSDGRQSAWTLLYGFATRLQPVRASKPHLHRIATLFNLVKHCSTRTNNSFAHRYRFVLK